MKRKGWNPMEDDMPAVVAIHNSVNETAWRQIKAWEALHSEFVFLFIHNLILRINIITEISLLINILINIDWKCLRLMLGFPVLFTCFCFYDYSFDCFLFYYYCCFCNVFTCLPFFPSGLDFIACLFPFLWCP